VLFQVSDGLDGAAEVFTPVRTAVPADSKQFRARPLSDTTQTL